MNLSPTQSIKTFILPRTDPTPTLLAETIFGCGSPITSTPRSTFPSSVTSLSPGIVQACCGGGSGSGGGGGVGGGASGSGGAAGGVGRAIVYGITSRGGDGGGGSGGGGSDGGAGAGGEIENSGENEAGKSGVAEGKSEAVIGECFLPFSLFLFLSLYSFTSLFCFCFLNVF